jgi:hypothetical protein
MGSCCQLGGPPCGSLSHDCLKVEQRALEVGVSFEHRGQEGAEPTTDVHDRLRGREVHSRDDRARRDRRLLAQPAIEQSTRRLMSTAPLERADAVEMGERRLAGSD